MLVIAGVDTLGAVLFAAVYALGGARLLSPAAFPAALAVSFVGVTAFWVHIERSRGPRRDLPSRATRIVVGLAVAVGVTPALVLMPLFYLRDQLPREAGVGDVLGPVMFLVLVSLALTVLANAAGAAFMTAQALCRRFGRPRPLR
jgi:hypothetical protein